VLSANAALGGLHAGIAQRLRGGSFQDGFARGALGGVVVYAGKRIVVERFDGAGLAGRQVAAVGTSMVRNAADGLPALERLVLPVGPVRVYMERAERYRPQARLDLMTLGWTLYAASVPDLEWDAQASLSAGAPVFRVHDRLIVAGGDTVEAAGSTFAGVILVADIPGLDVAKNLAHERVHVLQNDQTFLLWTRPLEQRALAALPGGATLDRWTDVNLSPAVNTTLSLLFRRYEHRPWEMEAFYLQER
jgi:hypothetical protein